jgi:hypothetical protein
MSKFLVALALGLVAQAAQAQDAATDGTKSKADPKSEQEATPASNAAAETKDEEFKPPRGFRTKKRGELVLYCQTDATLGTRFKTEKCYNEEQLRAYMLALESQRRDVDRIRTNCGGGPCTPYEPPAPS